MDRHLPEAQAPASVGLAAALARLRISERDAGAQEVCVREVIALDGNDLGAVRILLLTAGVRLSDSSKLHSAVLIAPVRESEIHTLLPLECCESLPVYFPRRAIEAFSLAAARLQLRQLQLLPVADPHLG